MTAATATHALGVLALELAGGTAPARQALPAAHRHAVQISLQQLRLAPAGFQLAGGGDLAKLADDAAALCGAGVVGVDQAGKLHRDGGRTLLRAVAREVGPCAARQARPVHAGVGAEAVVLGEHDRRTQRGGEIGERDPGQAAGGGVGADRLERGALAVEEGEVGGAVGGADFGVSRQGQRTRYQHRHSRECYQDRSGTSHLKLR